MKYFVLESILLLFLFVNVFVEGTTYKDCNVNKDSKLLNVSVKGCEQGVCPLKRGTNESFTIEFRAGKEYKVVKSVVHGILAGIPLPFKIPNPDGCKNSNLKCPLIAGKTYQYEDVIPVLTAYPTVKAIVKWELKDESGNDIVCIEVPIQIVN